jgi:hypothetical protein
MSYPYPQDRNRDRREKGEQPYKEAREAMAESQEQIQTEAEAFGEAAQGEHQAELVERLRANAVERLAEVGAERERAASERRSDTESPTG